MKNNQKFYRITSICLTIAGVVFMFLTKGEKSGWDVIGNILMTSGVGFYVVSLAGNIQKTCKRKSMPLSR